MTLTTRTATTGQGTQAAACASPFTWGFLLRHHLAELSRRVIRTMASWRVRPRSHRSRSRSPFPNPRVQVQQRPASSHRQGPPYDRKKVPQVVSSRGRTQQPASRARVPRTGRAHSRFPARASAQLPARTQSDAESQPNAPADRFSL